MTGGGETGGDARVTINEGGEGNHRLLEGGFPDAVAVDGPGSEETSRSLPPWSGLPP